MMLYPNLLDHSEARKLKTAEISVFRRLKIHVITTFPSSALTFCCIHSLALLQSFPSSLNFLLIKIKMPKQIRKLNKTYKSQKTCQSMREHIPTAVCVMVL